MGKRISKQPEERRAEILLAAKRLFELKGYEATSVDSIVSAVGVAKGTFYYYFKSKEDILDALVQQMVAEMVKRARVIVDDCEMWALEKLCAIFRSQNEVLDEGRSIFEGFHRPENRVIHERNNVEVVLKFGPVLAEVVEQGNKEGVFRVDNALSTVQFILAGSQVLLGEGVFNWTLEEKVAHTRAMLVLIERAFGANEGVIMDALGGVLLGDAL